MTMPAQKPGKSFQAYRTPTAFLDAVRRRLQIANFTIDLAADAENKVTDAYYSEANSAFDNPWNVGQENGVYGWAWCNPPFARIEPWASQAYVEGFRCNIAMLLPAAVGANWWRDWVDRRACVLFLNGRLSFDGKAPYPKDCALLLYGPAVVPGYAVWDWRQS